MSEIRYAWPLTKLAN